MSPYSKSTRGDAPAARVNPTRVSDAGQGVAHPVQIPAKGINLEGDLTIPSGAPGVVLFAHGSGSSRHSSRNQFVARSIQATGIGTLLFDLLSAEEEREEAETGHLRFNISLLAGRLEAAAQWMAQQPEAKGLGIGFFGASTGGAAALVAAAEPGSSVQAVVSRGGRPDLAGPALPRVTAPTLLLVGSRDRAVVQLNQQAYTQLQCEKQLSLIPGATHLFEEPGTLEQVATQAATWFRQHLRRTRPAN